MKRELRIPSYMLLLLTVVAGTPVFAQQSSHGVAEYVVIADPLLEHGSIIVLTEQGYVASATEYSNNIFGVIVSNPAVAWSQYPKNAAQAVISSGSAEVLVNNQEGPIAPGDWITTSSQPGVGMKATRTGMALGKALSSLDSNAAQGLIQVAVAPQLVSPSDPAGLPKNLRAALSALQAGFLAASAGGANTNTRYALAVLSFLIALLFAFWIFSRTATNSIAAVGRNPLAKKSIFLVAALNAMMAVGIAVAGLALGLFILGS